MNDERTALLEGFLTRYIGQAAPQASLKDVLRKLGEASEVELGEVEMIESERKKLSEKKFWQSFDGELFEKECEKGNNPYYDRESHILWLRETLVSRIRDGVYARLVMLEKASPEDGKVLVDWRHTAKDCYQLGKATQNIIMEALELSSFYRDPGSWWESEEMGEPGEALCKVLRCSASILPDVETTLALVKDECLNPVKPPLHPVTEKMIRTILPRLRS